jgi:hypothetical protein
VLRAILLSDDFAATWGQKVKKPFELIASFLRATGGDIRLRGENVDNLMNLCDGMGQHIFAWPTPTGHPDRTAYWTATNAMLGRWNAPLSMLNDDFKIAHFRLIRETPAEAKSCRQIARYWTRRLLGREMPAETVQLMVDFFAAEDNPDDVPSGSEKTMVDRLNALVSLIASLPEFQLC